jgi:hypothetical protein
LFGGKVVSRKKELAMATNLKCLFVAILELIALPSAAVAQDQEKIAALIDILKDDKETSAARVGACKSLAKYNEKAKDAVPVLIKIVEAKSDLTNAALETLCAIGPDAKAASAVIVQRLAVERDIELYVKTLKSIKADAKEVLPPLLKRLQKEIQQAPLGSDIQKQVPEFKKIHLERRYLRSHWSGGETALAHPLQSDYVVEGVLHFADGLSADFVDALHDYLRAGVTTANFGAYCNPLAFSEVTLEYRLAAIKCLGAIDDASARKVLNRIVLAEDMPPTLRDAATEALKKKDSKK